jgi:hypothetical protein
MRYCFWALFSAFVAYLLANKSNSVVGPAVAVGILSFGAMVGVAFAVATSPGNGPRLLNRLVGTVCWIALGTGVYFLVFRAVSYGPNATVLIRGLLICMLPPVVWIARGMARKRAEQ